MRPSTGPSAERTHLDESFHPGSLGCRQDIFRPSDVNRFESLLTDLADNADEVDHGVRPDQRAVQ
jgi:hypothetical protein